MKTKINLGPGPKTAADLTNTPQKLVFYQDGPLKREKKETEIQGPADYETAIMACGYGKFNYFLLLTLFPACAAQIFATGVMAFILPSAECDLKLTNFHKGALNASTYAGMMTSSFFWGFIVDVFGRRKLIIIGLLLDFILNCFGAFSPEFWLLFIVRFCVGLVIPAANAGMYSYVAETHSQEHRPKAIMITGAIYAFAQAILPALALLIIPMQFRITLIPGILDFVPWRLFILICCTSSLISGFLFVFFPESPKFLMSQGRLNEALESFRRIYAANTGSPQSCYPIKVLQRPLRDEVDVPQLETTTDTTQVMSRKIWTALWNGWAQIRPIFRPPYLKVALFLFSINTSIMLSFSSLRQWNPQLLTTLQRTTTSSLPNPKGATTICDFLTFDIVPSLEDSSQTNVCLPVQREVYILTLILGIAATACFMITIPLFDPIGRKTVARLCVLGGAASVLAINWATSIYLYVACVSLYIGIVEGSLSVLAGLVVDAFPTDFRSVAVALQLMSGRVGSMLGNLIFPALLSVSCQGTFFAIAGELTVVAMALLFIPKKPEGNVCSDV